MKKWGLFLAILAIAAAFAFADEVAAVQVDDLFADIEAVALSQGEMEAVDGGNPAAVIKVAKAALTFIAVDVAYNYVKEKADSYVKTKTGRSISENIDRFIERNFTIKGRVDRMMGM